MSDKLHKILTHQKTRDLFGRIARGDDPRQAVAQVAGASLAEGLARALGAALPAAEPGVPGKAATADDSNVIDAEFREINVTQQARAAAAASGKKSRP